MAAHQSGAQPVASHRSVAALLQACRWQKRVLLLCAPTADNTVLQRQRQLLAPARAGLDARDLTVREVVLTAVSEADRTYLAQRLRVSPSGFTLLLLGKDGGIKQRETKPVAPSSLFATIDAMPMRQLEVRRSKRQTSGQ